MRRFLWGDENRPGLGRISRHETYMSPERSMAKTKGHSPSPLVGVIMGSQSDWRIMRHASEQLDELGVPHEVKIVSAHRTPERLYGYAREAKDRGLKVIIAAAGGAAHLPGMTASLSARMAAASRPALVAPALPIARVPTGTPAGIWTME